MTLGLPISTAASRSFKNAAQVIAPPLFWTLFMTKNKSDLSRRQVLKAAGAITASVTANEVIAAKEANSKPSNLTPAQQAMEKLWEEHLASEFQANSAEAAANTMVEIPAVNHVPVMTGGFGRKQLTHFYGKYFISPRCRKIPRSSPSRGRSVTIESLTNSFSVHP